jgi:predicted GNAT family N-acyltransferase
MTRAGWHAEALTMLTGEVERVVGAGAFEEVMVLRYRVFCDEQGVPRDIERDDEDAFALHAVVRTAAGSVLATGRVLRMRADHRCVAVEAGAEPGDVARIGRMAVDAASRGTGVGVRVLGFLEREAKAAGLAKAVLHAQLHAEGFYVRAGYQRHGPEFDEAGIPHVEMQKTL